MKEENLKRFSVYIDGANFYYGLKTINQRYSDVFFDFEKFVKEIVRENKLVTICYYNAPLKENFNKYVYWNQMGLFARLRKIPKRFLKVENSPYLMKLGKEIIGKGNP